MNYALPVAAAQTAASLNLPKGRTPENTASCILTAANRILAGLERGITIETRILRQAMEEAFGGSDAEGFWSWKDAYEACETAQVLFLQEIWPRHAGKGGIARSTFVDDQPHRRTAPDPYAALGGIPISATVFDARAPGAGGGDRCRDYA